MVYDSSKLAHIMGGVPGSACLSDFQVHALDTDPLVEEKMNESKCWKCQCHAVEKKKIPRIKGLIFILCVVTHRGQWDGIIRMFLILKTQLFKDPAFGTLVSPNAGELQ